MSVPCSVPCFRSNFRTRAYKIIMDKKRERNVYLCVARRGHVVRLCLVYAPIFLLLKKKVFRLFILNR
jgi:hypothetical protein